MNKENIDEANQSLRTQKLGVVVTTHPLSEDMRARLPSGPLTVVELNDQLSRFVSTYIAATTTHLGSIETFKAIRAPKKIDVIGEDERNEPGLAFNAPRPQTYEAMMLSGLGLSRFTWNDTTYYMCMERHGNNSVSIGCGRVPGFFTSSCLVAVGNDKREDCKQFLDMVIDLYEKNSNSTSIQVYQFNLDYKQWDNTSELPPRSLDTVILKNNIKNKLIADIEEFVSKDTRKYYSMHGVPYRRGYLFYGPPGTGKTSMAKALAAKFHRNLCILQPSNPKFTDDILREAFQSVPHNSIMLLEDCDSLFNEKRENKVKNSNLTFSGMLNALDGATAATGQIVILSTNHREELDKAMIRNGRVDMHINFPSMESAQVADMLRTFRPGATQEQANTFAINLMETLKHENQDLSACSLQHYFVTYRKMPLMEILESWELIVKDMRSREEESQLFSLNDNSNRYGNVKQSRNNRGRFMPSSSRVNDARYIGNVPSGECKNTPNSPDSFTSEENIATKPHLKNKSNNTHDSGTRWVTFGTGLAFGAIISLSMVILKKI